MTQNLRNLTQKRNKRTVTYIPKAARTAAPRKPYDADWQQVTVYLGGKSITLRVSPNGEEFEVISRAERGFHSPAATTLQVAGKVDWS